MPNIKPDAKIFSITQSKVLAEKIAAAYGAQLGNVITSTYSDGEFQPSYEESIRGTRIFIIGSTNPSSENLMEMLLMLDAAKRASARHITAVLPYFGWARQDRKDKPRVPIAAKLVAKMLETAGATRIITMDLHADQIQGFFEKPVDHLFASTIFLPYLKELNLDNLPNSIKKICFNDYKKELNNLPNSIEYLKLFICRIKVLTASLLCLLISLKKCHLVSNSRNTEPGK